MIIKNIKFVKNKKNVTLRADVTFANAHTESVYFTTPLTNDSFVFKDSAPFLAAFLIPCMKRGENITIEGSVSKKQLENTKKIMKLFKKWGIGMHTIEVSAINVTKDTRKGQVGAFFSAGVDSFYTYFKNKSIIRNLILVNGFDIELENKILWLKTLKNVEKVAGEQKVRLITVETNIKRVIEKYVLWDWGHGGALGAVALFLRGGITTTYLAGSLGNKELFPYGTHPKLDIFWGTETLDLIHDGTECTRFEKVKSISSFKEALTYLHVCAQNRKGVYNCGECDKCLRTMTELATFGVLQKTKTFPDVIDLSLIKKSYIDKALRYDKPFRNCLMILKLENREKELQVAIEYSLKNSLRFSLKRAVVKGVKNFDQNYNNRRFYRLVFQMTGNQDRNVLFKALSVVGVIK